jgi:hypothetical protein
VECQIEKRDRRSDVRAHFPAFREIGWGVLLAVAPLLAVAALHAGVADGQELPTADLALVSMTANVHHARVGQDVTFTVVGTNNGPDAADFNVVQDPSRFYPVSYPPSDFTFVGRGQCLGSDSFDGSACEAGLVQPGETITTTFVTTVNATAPRDASNTVCVFSWGGPIDDPDPANDCVTTTVKIVGRPGQG